MKTSFLVLPEFYVSTIYLLYKTVYRFPYAFVPYFKFPLFQWNLFIIYCLFFPPLARHLLYNLKPCSARFSFALSHWQTGKEKFKSRIRRIGHYFHLQLLPQPASFPLCLYSMFLGFSHQLSGELDN